MFWFFFTPLPYCLAVTHSQVIVLMIEVSSGLNSTGSLGLLLDSILTDKILFFACFFPADFAFLSGVEEVAPGLPPPRNYFFVWRHP